VTRTRPALCEALLGLLEEKSFEQVTLREITARADIGYATFFRHYQDKEALFHDLAGQQISELLAMAVPILYTVDPRASTQALCAFVWEHRKLWTALLTGGAASMMKTEFIRQVQQIAARHPNSDSSIPTELRVLVPVSGTIELLAWWLKQEDPAPVSRMAELLDILVVTPSLATRREHQR
jgi:AcrR family transcriptional regulator